MPTFSYTAKDSDAQVVQGTIEADNQRSAISQLNAQGLFPIEVSEASAVSPVAQSSKGSGRIRLKNRNLFFRQLANLIQAGMPILRALNTLKEQSDVPRMEAIIGDLHSSVQEGCSFTEALERHPKAFPPIYTNLVKAGETGGMLEEVLWRIVSFGEKEEDLRGKVFTAMVYPAFLLCISSLTVFILVSFVFPKFVVIFDDFEAKLPAITTAVMTVTRFMGSFWWLVILLLLFCLLSLRVYLASAAGQAWKDRVLLSLPLLGGVVLRYEMAKFARTLGTLFDNGVPVLTALKITANTLSNIHIRQEVLAVESRVREGESISSGLKEDSVYFPPLVVNMIAVGEESGQLGDVTKRIADAYDVEVDRTVRAFTSILEPLIIVIMGIVVGVLVIAMLLPMLTLSSHIR